MKSIYVESTLAQTSFRSLKSVSCLLRLNQAIGEQLVSLLLSPIFFDEIKQQLYVLKRPVDSQT